MKGTTSVEVPHNWHGCGQKGTNQVHDVHGEHPCSFQEASGIQEEPASAQLCNLLLQDSGHLFDREALPQASGKSHHTPSKASQARCRGMPVEAVSTPGLGRPDMFSLGLHWRLLISIAAQGPCVPNYGTTAGPPCPCRVRCRCAGL